MPDSELLLRPSRRKLLTAIGGCLVFMAIGWWMRDSSPGAAWLSIVFCGLLALAGAVNLMPNACYLRLAQDGYEFRGLFRSHNRAWADIDHFVTFRQRGVTRAGIVFSRTFAPSRTVGAMIGVNRSIAQVDGGLSNPFPMSAKDLVALMNEWLVRYRDRQL